MHTTATLHVHPACASTPELIKQLQSNTGCLVVLHDRKLKLVAKSSKPTPFDPNGGGNAA
ncbi:hypothetical protein D3X12_14785 [Pseudomonas protegens]|jgi:hypothetical protein|uniref:Uncharacterized protein n=1 Tax=Pseudomonas protegens TaxID=380021 RepID=A0ABY2VKX3_9PSED|nr:hypothetical protein [Pseudomonas protegens]ASE25013.1 hypothetical protein CEP86_29995 [Pseudomonas protegens]QEZ55119.1 hypothetical protein D3X12_14785 [Pseudomonas protegens]QEZ61125.1 hypothetical protein D4N38_04690 [Pseudomonas protegens]QEZ67252.1 hypothetical protein D4N37_10110 [Pseudomonas protegens]QIC26973.1 hypothetical protein FQ342_00870 [Pseudomonas protegens]